MRNLCVILVYVLSCAAVSAQDECDVNFDGKVDANDINKVVNRICTGPSEHQSVNLGLSSGTLWATCNIGAKSPEDYGDYFAWGDVAGYFNTVTDGTNFEWADYKWISTGATSWSYINKYTVADGQKTAIWYEHNSFVGDGKTTLDSLDDAATVNWGKEWCMPTHIQIQELISQTNNEPAIVNGVYGRKFSSKKNPAVFIFLPAAGYCSCGSLCNDGKYGFYWAKNLYMTFTDLAWMYYFYSGNSSADMGANRCTGHSIRPVRNLSAQ